MIWRVISEKLGLVWTGTDYEEAEDMALAVAVHTGRTTHLQEGTTR